MNRLALTFAMILIIVCPCLAANRLLVPVTPVVAVAPQSFDERPAQATIPGEFPTEAAGANLGVAQPLPADSSEAFASVSPLAMQSTSANVGIMEASKADPSRAIASVSPLPVGAASANVRLTTDLPINSVGEAAFVRMALSCDADAALRDLLTGMGLTLRDAGPARALPEFLTGIDCDGPDTLKAAIPAGIVRAVRYVGEADPEAAYVAEHPDQQFIIIVDIDHLNAAVLKTLGGGNIVAIVVGHFHAFDARPDEFAGRAEDVKRVMKTIRLVSDAPALLAVSSLNEFTRRTEKGWTDAFGDDLAAFDGWAIYNFNQFPAIMEARENPRKMLLDRLGLADRSCVLLDFLGGPVEVQPGQIAWLTAAWKAKAKPFLAALKTQCWQGVIVYGATAADAEIKAASLAGN